MGNDDYRPRIRATRRHPVSRRANVIVVTCKDIDDAKAVEGLLKDIFKGASQVQKAMDLFDNLNAIEPATLNPDPKAADIIDIP